MLRAARDGRVDGFWLRLRRSKLVQWAAAYVAAAFAFIQVLDVVAQRFGWPDRVEKLLILALAVGFLVALVIAWYHGERGAQRVSGIELAIIALLLAFGGGALWMYARTPRMAPGAAIAGASAPAASRAPAVRADAVALRGALAAIPAKSVAVLPFTNESGEQGQQFFSDGISEDLITALSQLGGLKVISRNSAFQFRDSRESSAEIGRLLGVAHLLEGSVQRVGDEVRITATLVDAASGAVLWSQRYDRPYQDLFALQDAITRSVADALQAELLTAPGAVLQSDRPPGGSLAAYTAYQHGVAYNALATGAGYRLAIDAFRRAIRIDPGYAAAYARLAFVWANLASTGAVTPAQALADARTAADTALRIAPDSSLAHQASALVRAAADMDWAGAAADAQRALQLAPNDAAAQFSVGNADATLGRVQAAVARTRQALASDPRHAGWYRWLSSYLMALNRLDDARRALDTAMTLQPGALYDHEQLAILELLHGDPRAALVAARQEPPGVWHDLAMTLAVQRGSDPAAAAGALHHFIASWGGAAPYQIAEVYALRSDPNAMFEWLDRAREKRDPGIAYLLFDPFILRYRDDPRFAAFCRKVGLPATTDAVAMQ